MHFVNNPRTSWCAVYRGHQSRIGDGKLLFPADLVRVRGVRTTRSVGASAINLDTKDPARDGLATKAVTRWLKPHDMIMQLQPYVIGENTDPAHMDRTQSKKRAKGRHVTILLERLSAQLAKLVPMKAGSPVFLVSRCNTERPMHLHTPNSSAHSTRGNRFSSPRR